MWNGQISNATNRINVEKRYGGRAIFCSRYSSKRGELWTNWTSHDSPVTFPAVPFLNDWFKYITLDPDLWCPDQDSNILFKTNVHNSSSCIGIVAISFANLLRIYCWKKIITIYSEKRFRRTPSGNRSRNPTEMPPRTHHFQAPNPIKFTYDLLTTHSFPCPFALLPLLLIISYLSFNKFLQPHRLGRPIHQLETL